MNIPPFLFGWGDYAKEQQVKVDKDKEEEEAEKARQSSPFRLAFRATKKWSICNENKQNTETPLH